MASLWATECENGSEMYVDFLSVFSEDGPGNPKFEFIEWDVRSINTDWQRKFHDIELESHKQKSIAKTLVHHGNQCYKQNLWRDAMEYFNQALYFTKIDSIYLNTFIAKRAMCFGKMEMYENAIIDADTALTSNLPHKMESKLRKERAAWEEKLKVSMALPTAKDPVLSFDADNECPSMANVLEIKETDDFKSYVVARADIDVGQVVLIETGFVSIANGYDRAYCLTCLKTLANFFPCPNCSDAMFCNIDCMTTNTVHNIWCNEPFNRMPMDVRFVVQSILQAFISFPSVDGLMEFVSTILHLRASENIIEFQHEPNLFDYGLFLCLLSSSDEDIASDSPLLLLIYKVYKTLMSMSSIQLQFDTEIKRRFLMHLVGHHAHVLTNNSFGGVFADKIEDRKQFVTGKVSAIAALIEHSCTPNLMHFPIGNREIFITLRPIRAGEHLNFDYWLEWPNEIKRDNWSSLLHQSKGIRCECGKCEQHTINNENMSDNQLYHFILNFIDGFGMGQVQPILKRHCMNFLRTFAGESWSMEMELVTKTLAKCFLTEFSVER